MSWIARMREKPRSTRVHIALFVALVITVMVGVVWVLALPARFSETANTASQERDTTLQSFIDQTKREFSGVSPQQEDATTTREDVLLPRDAYQQAPREVLVGTSTGVR